MFSYGLFTKAINIINLLQKLIAMCVWSVLRQVESEISEWTQTTGHGHATWATFHCSGFMPTKTINLLNIPRTMFLIRRNIFFPFPSRELKKAISLLYSDFRVAPMNICHQPLWHKF